MYFTDSSAFLHPQTLLCAHLLILSTMQGNLLSNRIIYNLCFDIVHLTFQNNTKLLICFFSVKFLILAKTQSRLNGDVGT